MREIQLDDALRGDSRAFRGQAPERGPAGDTVGIGIGAFGGQGVAERERDGGLPAWVWVASGVALTGIGVGTYFLLKSGDEGPPPPAPGSLGTLNLPLGF